MLKVSLQGCNVAQGVLGKFALRVSMVKFHKCPSMSICCYLTAIGLKWCPRAAARYRVDEA